MNISKEHCISAIYQVIFLLLFLFSSCKSTAPKIGFMLPNDNVRRYLVERDVFTAKVKEMGGEVLFKSAENDEEKQVQQLKDILQEGIDVLVLDPVNRFRGAEMVRMAHNKGIKVISYDRLVANCDVDALVTFDANAIGKQMAEYTLSKKPSGNYIILGGDKSDINAVMIDDAVEISLGQAVKSGNIKIMYKTFVEKYSQDDSENIVSICLQLSDKKPDAIITSSDAMANGAITALEKAKMNESVVITGQNAELYACKHILSGKQTMTIYKAVKKLASSTAEIAVRISRGDRIGSFFKATLFNGATNVPANFFDVIPVDNSNLKSTVIADGFYKESEVFN